MAVGGRIVESLHTQHAAADAALLRTACALADGSANLMPRTPSMVREAEVCILLMPKSCQLAEDYLQTRCVGFGLCKLTPVSLVLEILQALR